MASVEDQRDYDPTRVEDELRQLEAAMEGRLVGPSSADWDQARQAWNLTADLRPIAVAEVASVDDVKAVVTTAGRAGLRVAPLSTGHNAGPLPDLDRVILLKLGALRVVTIDVPARRARAGGGARWSDVIGLAGMQGLGAPAGTSRDVGVIGYLLGGGMSWFVGSHGPAADHVTAIELVTADGQLRRVDSQNEPELFWALRGGGGSFGVVTAIEFELLPISTVQGGKLVWPIESASEVLHEWRQWIATVPRQVTSVGRLLSRPSLPMVPEEVRGKAFVQIEVVSQLDKEQTDRLLTRFRALSPVVDTVRDMPVSELWQIHGDPAGPVPGTGDGILLGCLPAPAVDAMIAAFQQPLVSFELRHLGRAFTSRHGGVVACADAEIGAFAAALVLSPDELESSRQQVRSAVAAVSPWATGTTYQNFAESPRPLDELFPKDTVDRLRAVRKTYDPGNLVLANHNVDPA